MKLIENYSDKEYKSWRKSVEKDGLTKEISVKECENGFYICISKYGDENGKFNSEEKRYISTKNPLEGEKEYNEEITLKDEIMESIKAMGL